MGWWALVVWIHEEKNANLAVGKKTWLWNSHAQKSATIPQRPAPVSYFWPDSTTTRWHICVSPSSSLDVQATETTLNRNICVNIIVFLKRKSLNSSPRLQWH